MYAFADDPDPGIAPAVAASASPLVAVDIKGLMRLRGHYLRDASLGNGTSGVAATPASDKGEGADAFGLGDLRFRFEPTLHLGSRGRVDAQIDAAGYMVLGDDPRDGSISGRPYGFEGDGSKAAGLGVRRLWATWDVFGIGQVIIGRTPDHFGLGILRNSGANARVDYQSDVDRVAVQAELLDLRLRLSRDLLGTLPMIPDYGSPGRPYGLQDSSDVVRWLAELHGGLKDDLKWGISLAYQDQTVALNLEHDPDPSARLNSDCVLTGGECSQLVPRSASLIMPQAYIKLDKRTGLGVLRIAAEAAFVAGTIDKTDNRTTTDSSTALISGGFAAELSLTRPGHVYSLHLGAATGDDEGGFGVLDQHNLTKIDETEPDPNKKVQTRPLLTGFRFHRGYLVDALLFREVIGAVANAAYVRPAWRWQPGTAGQVIKPWLEVSCLAGVAMQTGATPGHERLLGIEPELLAGIDTQGGQRALLHASYLLPGAAFDAGKGGVAASGAWRVLAEWHVPF